MMLASHGAPPGIANKQALGDEGAPKQGRRQQQADTDIPADADQAKSSSAAAASAGGHARHQQTRQDRTSSSSSSNAINKPAASANRAAGGGQGGHLPAAAASRVGGGAFASLLRTISGRADPHQRPPALSRVLRLATGTYGGSPAKPETPRAVRAPAVTRHHWLSPAALVWHLAHVLVALTLLWLSLRVCLSIASALLAHKGALATAWLCNMVLTHGDAISSRMLSVRPSVGSAGLRQRGAVKSAVKSLLPAAVACASLARRWGLYAAGLLLSIAIIYLPVRAALVSGAMTPWQLLRYGLLQPTELTALQLTAGLPWVPYRLLGLAAAGGLLACR